MMETKRNIIRHFTGKQFIRDVQDQIKKDKIPRLYAKRSGFVLVMAMQLCHKNLEMVSVMESKYFDIFLYLDLITFTSFFYK